MELQWDEMEEMLFVSKQHERRQLRLMGQTAHLWPPVPLRPPPPGTMALVKQRARLDCVSVCWLAGSIMVGCPLSLSPSSPRPYGKHLPQTAPPDRCIPSAPSLPPTPLTSHANTHRQTYRHSLAYGAAITCVIPLAVCG